MTEQTEQPAKGSSAPFWIVVIVIACIWGLVDAGSADESSDASDHCEQAWESYTAGGNNPTGIGHDTYIKRCHESEKEMRKIYEYTK